MDVKILICQDCTVCHLHILLAKKPSLMKKTLLFLSLTLMGVSYGQTWSKISSNLDSLWTSSVTYFNKGDTIIYYGSTTGTGAFNAKRFYISTDGGYSFNRDFTKLDAIGFTPIMGLRINNLILGHINTPNLGVYSFQSLNNWSSLLPSTTAIFGEVNSGTIFYNLGGGSTTLRSMPASGGTSSVVASGTNGIDMLCSYNKGNRLFIGGGTANIKYLDAGDFSNIQSSTITPAISGSNFDVVRFFESGSALYTVISNGYDYLYKSTDNGINWSLQPTTYTVGANTYTLNSSFIMGTPNGNIFFLKNGNSDDVYLSKDGGLSATKIPTGLPSNALGIGPLSKILVSGNKVWYQVKAANNTDFVRTDTSIAGLYTFIDGATNIEESQKEFINYTIYPNPAKNFINILIHNGYGKNYEITLTNILGKELIKTTNASDNYAISTSELNPGIYFITVRHNNLHLIKKLIIE